VAGAIVGGRGRAAHTNTTAAARQQVLYFGDPILLGPSGRRHAAAGSCRNASVITSSFLVGVLMIVSACKNVFKLLFLVHLECVVDFDINVDVDINIDVDINVDLSMQISFYRSGGVGC
jgi:hypothetical protein